MKDVSESDLTNNIPLVALKEGESTKPVTVAGVEFGGNDFAIIAGPCTVESEEQIVEIAGAVKQRGAKMLRGGAFKPLSFPYRSDSFFELGEVGLEYLNVARKTHNIPVVTELMDIKYLDKLCENADMIQIGSRNMQNFSLLAEVGGSGFPVLLKRHFGCSLRDWLGAAEYLVHYGCKGVVLCERGITAPHTHVVTSRFIVDLQVVPAVKELSHLPIIVDPSHSTFRRNFVPHVALGACGVGADGIIIDVHPTPEKAAVDPLNALTYDAFETLVGKLNNVKKVI
ncbi:MAG: 3-deoxy-7-phosphoheptulonate synthase [Nitrospiraceae bacterium]|nr:3-deoxy-7-phosphoheptulonate synthase [Nitrospiraceae bacterium]